MSLFEIILMASYVSSASCVAVVVATITMGVFSQNSLFVPAYGLFNFSMYASIYSAADMGATKQLTGLQVNRTGYTTPYTYLNQEIWIGEISNSTFPTSTPAVDFSDLTFTKPLVKVKNAFTDTIATNNVWTTFNFDTNFCWSGSNNLLVLWKNLDGTWASGYGTGQTASATNKGMQKASDASYPTGTGTRTNSPSLYKFNY